MSRKHLRCSACPGEVMRSEAARDRRLTTLWNHGPNSSWRVPNSEGNWRGWQMVKSCMFPTYMVSKGLIIGGRVLDSPSLASYHLKCHASSLSDFHSALYLRMGTPPVASGSSNCTCAVLEYGSTRSMDGEDGVSVSIHMDTHVMYVAQDYTLKYIPCFCSLFGILSKSKNLWFWRFHFPSSLQIGLNPSHT